VLVCSNICASIAAKSMCRLLPSNLLLHANTPLSHIKPSGIPVADRSSRPLEMESTHATNVDDHRALKAKQAPACPSAHSFRSLG
jgi:hypothetical protein